MASGAAAETCGVLGLRNHTAAGALTCELCEVHLLSSERISALHPPFSVNQKGEMQLWTLHSQRHLDPVAAPVSPSASSSSQAPQPAQQFLLMPSESWNLKIDHK